MGLIRFFKEIAALRKMIKELPAELESQADAQLQLSTAEMATLSDEELFSAAVCRAGNIVESCEELSDGFAALSEYQKVLYAVNCLEMEVNNGGLCQFFVNSTRILAPHISGYVEAIGAMDHKQLFDGFISRHRIDLDDLSSFSIRRVRDFEKQAARYPFDEYDDAFYGLDTLEIPLTAYIRAHVDAF